MAENKRSFLLYTDVYHTVKKLTDIQAGVLFKHILGYVNDENPVTNDFIIEIAFEPIKQCLKRDLKKYEAIKERNKKNGSKGGRPKSESKKPKKPSGLIRNPKNPHEPRKADNDNDNDNDSVNDTVIDSVIEIYQNTGFSKIEKLTDLRKSHLSARIKEYGFDKVCEVIKKADQSNFLHGKNNNGWKANFDWIINPQNFIKVLEGNYENKKEIRMLA